MFKQKKLDFIYKKLSSEDVSDADLHILDKLSRDRDSFIRQQAADLLYNIDSPGAEKLLLGMLGDKCSDVRSSACRSLCTSCSSETIEALIPLAANDKDILTRGYALISVIEIAVRINAVSDGLTEFLETGLRKEAEPWVTAAYHYALYIAGKEEYLTSFLEGLNNADYRVRCMTANLLTEAANKDNNTDIIKASLRMRLGIEDTVAARSSVMNALKALDNVS